LIGKQDGKHQKRSASESNNIRISKVVKRDTAEIADVETTEKVIQVTITYSGFNLWGGQSLDWPRMGLMTEKDFNAFYQCWIDKFST